MIYKHSWIKRSDGHGPKMSKDGIIWWRDSKCLHDSCTKCRGAGVDNRGQTCVHMISCTCSRCSPYTM